MFVIFNKQLARLSYFLFRYSTAMRGPHIVQASTISSSFLPIFFSLRKTVEKGLQNGKGRQNSCRYSGNAAITLENITLQAIT